MTAFRPRTILKLALEAAERSTLDSGEGLTSVKEIGLLNEPWVQSYIGDAVSRHLRATVKVNVSRPFVTYETSAAWINYFCQKKAPGPYANFLSDKSRFDLTVWNHARQIEGLIEIKDEPVMGAYSKARDPEKLIAALRKWPDIKWGIFLYSVRATDHYDDGKMTSHLAAKCEKVRETVAGIDSRFRFHFAQRPSSLPETKCIRWGGAIVSRAII